MRKIYDLVGVLALAYTAAMAVSGLLALSLDLVDYLRIKPRKY